MIIRYIKWILWVFGFLLITYGAFADEEESFRESVVIFNTICAKCHEAECSGRLSIGFDIETSGNHIIRHYGKASGEQWLQKELFSILNHMKEKCAYYPMSISVPPNRIWNSKILDKMSTLSERNYFIPIGQFTTGHYNLELKLAEDTKVTVHLVSDTFDMAIECCFQSSNQRLEIPFTIEEVGNYYVRVYPRKPVQITQVVISTVNPN